VDVFQAAKDLIDERLEMRVCQGLSTVEKAIKLVGVLRLAIKVVVVWGMVDVEIVGGNPVGARALRDVAAGLQ